jgi:hypothetical protein
VMPRPHIARTHDLGTTTHRRKEHFVAQ